MEITAAEKFAYSVEDACKMLSIGRTHLFDLMRGENPRIASVKSGRRRLIPASALRAYLETEQTPAGAAGDVA